MYGYQSPIPQMIQTGQFGAYSPMQQTNGYNPYINQQQIQVVNSQYQQPQQFNNNFVFQPINTNYTYYQEPRYNYYNPYGAQPYNNYYNPYGGAPQYYNNYQNPYGYQNSYYTNYQSYGNYSPFISPAQQQKMMNEQVELMKIKHRIAAGFYGKTIDEDELDRIVNPRNEVNMPTQEEIANAQETQFMNYLSALARLPVQYENNADIQAKYARMYSENMHKELDNHSMAEFFDEDLWKLQREEWIRQNISRSASRNLSKTYDSNEYNELLNMHKGSNPYINEILDNSKYDNNIDDLELGMNDVFNRERRRLNVLTGKVPSFISSEETQKRRSAWTSQIMDQIYKKGAAINV